MWGFITRRYLRGRLGRFYSIYPLIQPWAASCLIDGDISRAFLLLRRHTRVTFSFFSYYLYSLFVLCESTSFTRLLLFLFSTWHFTHSQRPTKNTVTEFSWKYEFPFELLNYFFLVYTFYNTLTGGGEQQKISLSSSAVNFTGFICGHNIYLHT